MQTNYMPKMSLRNKIVTGVAIGILSLVSGGCATKQSTYIMTPEQRAYFTRAMIKEGEERVRQRQLLVQAIIQGEENKRYQVQQTQQNPQKEESVLDKAAPGVLENLAIRGILDARMKYGR